MNYSLARGDTGGATARLPGTRSKRSADKRGGLLLAFDCKLTKVANGREPGAGPVAY